jgi:hypothetical protein
VPLVCPARARLAENTALEMRLRASSSVLVLSQLVLNYLQNLPKAHVPSCPVPARATELGSKMVAGRFRNVRGAHPVTPVPAINAKNGFPTAYRWSGERALSPENVVYVKVRSES